MAGAKNNPTFIYEQKLWQQGFCFVIGLDEVGRGPLAGPVCAAAVCFCAQKQTADPKLKDFENLKDSKKLSAGQREAWYKILTKHSDIKWGIGLVSEKIIDQINILEATKLAMRRAIEKLGLKPDFLLLDGNFVLEDLPINQKSVIRGDEKVISCAAASIIAKVTRDRLMVRYHAKYPPYGFDKHKGYGTRVHLAAIKEHGPCAIHRFSFTPCNQIKRRA